ncbi:hypothetical protein D9615_010161 [Tricholomella constricta]|uniref:Uncharacterized protein n=1 Tax=Tricholomella constricta TaxID=117010 RepID=A0A8H5GRP3_9AGAR|nr:hypothetical protein D9615_010161 [Tricholomella constricta]
MLSRFTRTGTALAIHPRRIATAALFHTSRAVCSGNAEIKHTADSYQKDVDPTPPSDSSIYRVDPSSECVQKPHEAPSGEWSRAGTRTSEYQSVSKTEPYTLPGKDTRYGGKESWAKEKGPETSKRGEGPEGKDSGGRKQERR